jgi:hypothetical protein
MTASDPEYESCVSYSESHTLRTEMEDPGIEL